MRKVNTWFMEFCEVAPLQTCQHSGNVIRTHNTDCITDIHYPTLQPPIILPDKTFKVDVPKIGSNSKPMRRSSSIIIYS